MDKKQHKAAEAKNALADILSELQACEKKIDAQQLEQYAAELAAAKRIFAAGAGRSGLMIRSFAMRLMHLGKEVHMIGDVSTPCAKAGDLLLIGSGSGETKSLLAAAQKGKSIGMRIALNTMNASSPLAQAADVVLVLPGASPKAEHITQPITSIQPMGSLYEQVSLLVYDALILTFMKRTGWTSSEMFARHANIE